MKSHQIRQAHVESWAKSGLTQKEYCSQHNIKLATFSLWRKRYHRPHKESLSFINANSQVQEETLSGKMVLQLLLPNGVRLGLNEHASDAFLQQVLHFAGAL